MFRYLVLFSWIIFFILLLVRFKGHLISGPVKKAFEFALLERQDSSLPSLWTEEESKESVITILRSWEFERFYGTIHRDLRRQIPADGLKGLFQTIAGRLGALQSLDTYRTHHGSRGSTASLTVKIDGTFLKGRALIEVEFLKTDSGWKIFQFAVESPEIVPVYEAAQAAVLEGGFDLSVFRKGLN